MDILATVILLRYQIRAGSLSVGLYRGRERSNKPKEPHRVLGTVQTMPPLFEVEEHMAQGGLSGVIQPVTSPASNPPLQGLPPPAAASQGCQLL